MRVFALPQVTRLLRKERLPDAVLCATAREVLAGRLGAGEADLGGGLWKKRLARPGGGKRGGYRVIVAYQRPRGERVLFAFCFAKSAASTMTPAGHEALSRAAAAFVDSTDAQLGELLAAGDVREVKCDDGEGENGGDKDAGAGREGGGRSADTGRDARCDPPEATDGRG